MNSKNSIIRIAHRSGPTVFPEQTVESARLALNNGADWVEVDIRRSLDGVPIVSHDADTGRLFGMSKKTAELKAEEYCSYTHLAEPFFHAHRLEDYLLAQIKPLLLHIKETEVLEQTAELLKRYDYQPEQVIFGVSSTKAVKTVKSLMPKAKVLAFLPKRELAEEFIDAGADVIRLWESWLNKSQKRYAVPVFIMTDGLEVGVTSPEGLRKIKEYHPEGILINDVTLLGENKKQKQGECAMPQNKPLFIGYHTNINEHDAGLTEFDWPCKSGKGVDFVLCHVDPMEGKTVQEHENRARAVAEVFKELGVDFIVNFEHQNFVENACTSDGFDWANREDGTHLLRLPQSYVRAFHSLGNCIGLMYDEFEHVIIHRNVSITMAHHFLKERPAFIAANTKNPLVQGEFLSHQLKDYVKELKDEGALTLSGEHVFPVLFHMFAENGIIPNFKSQKESFSNVQFAIAAGAAKEYGLPLFNCVDLWCRLTFPGHSAKEMFNNLCFAYLTGVNRVYVESANRFFDDDRETPNEYGKLFREFADEYKGRERLYDVQDYEPEIGIVRYDDTFWGQGRMPVMWRNMLFGNPKIKADKKCREWIKVFNLITHGETGNGGISWGRLELRSLTRHRSFASMNAPVVYDSKVKEEHLKTLKLCFICGYDLSVQTERAIIKLCYENGLTVVTTPRFAPKDCKISFFTPYKEYKMGKGSFIVVNSFQNPLLKKRLKGFLGKKGEMRYVFNGKEIVMKIDEDGDDFTCL